MENFQTYPVRPTQERCNKLGIKPLPEVLIVLAEESPFLQVKSKNLVFLNRQKKTTQQLFQLSHKIFLICKICSFQDKSFHLQVLKF
jgi:hypothetical protein